MDPVFFPQEQSGRVCSHLDLSDIQSCRLRSLFHWRYAEHHNATVLPQVIYLFYLVKCVVTLDVLWLLHVKSPLLWSFKCKMQELKMGLMSKLNKVEAILCSSIMYILQKSIKQHRSLCVFTVWGICLDILTSFFCVVAPVSIRGIPLLGHLQRKP